MAHGYLEDGYGIHGDFDPDRGDERRERGSHERDDGRRWRGDESRGRDRDREAMFGSWDGDRSDDSRRSDRAWRSEGGERWPQDRWPEQRGRADSYNRQAEDWSGQRRHSANPDDHYRSWRDRHMSELDRDYDDYCREREQQFHRDFDSWRRERHGNPQPLRTGMTNSGLSHDPSGELQLETEASAPIEPDPVSDATLGTNAADRGTSGRRR
jgi:hypothetical protein